MNVTIAGLTGKMAQLIAKHLLASPGVKVRGLCRTPSKLPESLTSNPRLSVFQADANDIEVIRSALKRFECGNLLLSRRCRCHDPRTEALD
jgi:uncharacterized protein YbjT (DUF2867 family)